MNDTPEFIKSKENGSLIPKCPECNSIEIGEVYLRFSETYKLFCRNCDWKWEGDFGELKDSVKGESKI